MAVEAQHLNLFPPQFISNRDFAKTSEANVDNIYNSQMGYGLPCTGTMPETLLSIPQSVICDSVPAKTSMKSDSGLTCNLPAPKKRSRDSLNQLNAFTVPQKTHIPESSSFLGDNIPFQIQQNQLEIDYIIAEHTKKVRLELVERQKQHARLLVSAIGEGMMKKLKEKEEMIQRMGQLNWALQEKVKNLYIENQVWRDLAQTNEATANSLRSNLEQVLAHVGEERLYGGGGGGGATVADEAMSCCGSSDHGNAMEEQRRVAEEEGGERVKKAEVAVVGGGSRDRMCRKCGERESCVLLLPCRHLCLCTLCGSTLHTCPVCNSNMNVSLHVNMS